MPKKYLELESTYRNRNLCANQGSFDVQISQSGVHDRTSAVDPITDAYPIKTFTIADEVITGSINVFVDPPTNGLFVSSTTKFIFTTAAVITAPSNKFIKNYYVGAVIYKTQVPAVIDDGPFARILEWIYIKNSATGSQFSVVVDTGFPYEVFYTSTNFSIGQMSLTAQNQLFIPSAENSPNTYSGYYVFNQNIGANPRYTQITNFDEDTHLAVAQTNIGTWATASDVLVLRKSLPNIYNGQYMLYNTTPVYLVGTTPPGPNYNICTLAVDNLGVTLINSDPSYINSFVRYYPDTIPQLPTAPKVTRIIGVVVRVSGGNIVTPFYAVDTTGLINRKYVNIANTPPFVITPTPWIATEAAIPTVPTVNIIEIMPYTTDNFSPFVYNGSLASQNQTVAYEVSLNSLILPNVVLENGGRIAYYPYVYVELENIGSSSSNVNTIYSNNPNSYKAIFKVPITDLNHPTSAPFVKLTGNGMVQTIPFKINSDMRVSVKLPFGSLFTTQLQDNSNGQRPNPLLQIAFTFEVNRI